MRTIRITSRFRKDMDRLGRQGKDTGKVVAIAEMLRKDDPLPERHKPHKLAGKWNEHMECHIESDWLLVFVLTPSTLFLVRTGSHSELFKK